MITQILGHSGPICPVDYSRWIGWWQISVWREDYLGGIYSQPLCYARTEEEARQRLDNYLAKWHPEPWLNLQY